MKSTCISIFVSRAKYIILICMSMICMHEVSAQNGLFVEYYDGQNFDKFVSSGYVDNINDEWWDVPPVAGVDPYSCSIRWTGRLRPAKSARYIFSALVDDGIRVWIDDRLIIDQWNLNDEGVFEGAIDLESNKDYDLKVEYFNALKEGQVRLLWAIGKAKEDLSWMERLFGYNATYEIIKADYFYRPELVKEQSIMTQTIQVSEEWIETQVDVSIPSERTPIRPKENTQSTHTEATDEPMTIARAEKYIPKHIEFVRAKAEILAISNKELDIFADFMLNQPHVTVLIEGHTDAVGDPKENLKLSKQRANKIARYLVQKGISGLRIKTEGYGCSRPLVVPAEGEYYPANRRVVFVLDGLD